MVQLGESHYINSFLYLIEQTNFYVNEVAETCFKTNDIQITFNEFKALNTLLLNNGICQIDLAKLILKDRGVTSRIIDSLENRGMAERKSETKKKRLVKNIYITEKGKKIIKEVTEQLHQITDDLFTEISDGEIVIMENALKKIQECISKAVLIKF